MRVLIDFCNSQSQTYAFSFPPPSSTWYFRRGLFLDIANYNGSGRHTLHFTGPLTQLLVLKNLMIVLGLRPRISALRASEFVSSVLMQTHYNSRPSASYFGPSGLRIRLFRIQVGCLTGPNAKLFNYYCCPKQYSLLYNLQD